MKRLINSGFLLISLFHCFACESLDDFDNQVLAWKWLDTGKEDAAHESVVYEESFGSGNPLRENQSMCVWADKAFCFIDGNECKVLDLKTKQWLASNPLPIVSHQNNAQFLNTFYDREDKYPLLLLSRGDYPPSTNDAYIIRVKESEEGFSYSTIKTIHNSINEAKNGGCWVADEDNEKIYLYCMTLGDWRLNSEDNRFCVFSFPIPNLCKFEDIILGYSDVLEKWEYTYLIHQGGTFHNGYLFFNVESMNPYMGVNIATSKDVIAINTRNGLIETILPLRDNKETEGICIYNNKLYISFKNGKAKQSPDNIVFSLKEYSLPDTIIFNNI